MPQRETIFDRADRWSLRAPWRSGVVYGVLMGLSLLYWAHSLAAAAVMFVLITAYSGWTNTSGPGRDRLEARLARKGLWPE